MYKYLLEVEQYLKYKILFGILTAVFTESFFKVMVLFTVIEFMDVFTRWICQSKKCFHALYPDTKAGFFVYVKFLWQARKWRFIRSEAMRQGVDKILLYLIILLVASLVDAAMIASAGAKFALLISVTVLGCTEFLSVLENLSEITNENVILKIKEKIVEKMK